jgi:RHS repeat-associated protein
MHWNLPDALRWAHYNYYRDYDPSLGRYTESDPTGLDGGINTYSFVDGAPVSSMDPYGLLSYKPPLPPVPGKGGTACDGKGGVDIRYPPDWNPFAEKCLGDCVRVHENKHISDFRKEDPNVCKNVKRGWTINFGTSDANSGSERGAYDAEAQCLRSKLGGGGVGGTAGCECKEAIQNRLKDIPKYRRAYE